MAKTVSIIPYAKPAERLKKVAAYARVSCGKDTMLHSMSAQVSNYSELIQSTPGWQYAGVYADEALSGTKTRGNFQQMIRDCRDGKIDMIITKSICLIFHLMSYQKSSRIVLSKYGHQNR